MLRLPVQLTKMHLLELMMMMMMMIWAFTGMTAAQPRCDPLTQYVLRGECCKMCGPGTSMSSLGTCLEPQCQECGKNEYQDKYTKEPKCKRQRYCDPNINFEVSEHDSKTQSTCVCKVGFHCSSEDCITCVPHTDCEPGHGAQSKGNHTHDTVCQKCPEGTYSAEKSWDGVCKKWTECGNGQHIEQSGTDVSDNICVETSRTHIVLLAVLPVILAVLVVAVMLWRCRDKRRDAEGKVKSCVESCLGEKNEPPREAFITNPTVEEESTFPEMPTPQEESFLRTPVEDEDEPSQESATTEGGFTLNGNLVRQENGKTEILSRQESQPQTFTA